jgi:hypothetical protein
VNKNQPIEVSHCYEYITEHPASSISVVITQAVFNLLSALDSRMT